MHTKPTVKYICEEFVVTGNQYYFKQEFLMEHKEWGRLRPVSEGTFLKRKKDGFKIEYRQNKKTPAIIVPFSLQNRTERRQHAL